MCLYYSGVQFVHPTEHAQAFCFFLSLSSLHLSLSLPLFLFLPCLPSCTHKRVDSKGVEHRVHKSNDFRVVIIQRVKETQHTPTEVQYQGI